MWDHTDGVRETAFLNDRIVPRQIETSFADINTNHGDSHDLLWHKIMHSKALGVTMPPTPLAHGDEVIE